MMATYSMQHAELTGRGGYTRCCAAWGWVCVCGWVSSSGALLLLVKERLDLTARKMLLGSAA